MKIPAAKAAVDKEWEKLEKISTWNLTKVRSKKEVIDEARTSGTTVHFASLMDICHLKNAELEAKHQKYKGRVVLRGDIVRDDTGSYAVFTEQGSSASQMTAAKVMDIISRLSGCDGQAADAVSAYTQVKTEDKPKILKIPKSEHLDSSNATQMAWIMVQYGRPSRVLVERNLYGHPVAGLWWKRQFEKILLQHGWEKVSNWECFFVYREKGLFFSVYVDDIKLAGKKQNLDPMWNLLNKDVDLGEPTFFLDHENLGCTQRECEISKGIVDNYRAMFESWISPGGTQKLPYSEFSYLFVVLWHGSHAKKCVERYWVSKQDDSTTLQSLHASMTTTSKKKKWNLLENCHFVLSNCSKMLKLGTNWKTWYSLFSEQNCTIDHEMDQSLRQTLESIDFIYSSSMWIQTILLCG